MYTLGSTIGFPGIMVLYWHGNTQVPATSISAL